MKYDIEGIDKSKIIKKYKVKKKANGRYDISIYSHDKTVTKSKNCSYEQIIIIKKNLDRIMFRQMKTLVESDDIALKTLSEVAANKAECFNRIGKAISIVFPIFLTIFFLNSLNLLLIPILLSTTIVFRYKYQLDTIDVEYDNYKKYEIFVNHKEEFDKMKVKNIEVNTIDNISIKKLEKLKEEILALKEEPKVKKLVK